MFRSFAAVGDSFTEGVGDEPTPGVVRGWADRVAEALARAAGAPIPYANLAVRGRKLGPIILEQLEPAIRLRPELLSINGGGNDLMRPRVDIDWVADTLDAAVDRARAAGIHVLLISGGNPSAHMPLTSLMQHRGDQLAAALYARFPRAGVTLVDNWSDATLGDARYWSADHIHLNRDGHLRVASNVLTALGVPVPEDWAVAQTAAMPAGPHAHRGLGYYREYVLPWIGRRLTGRSSGDGRSAKRPELTPYAPEAASGDSGRTGEAAAPPDSPTR